MGCLGQKALATGQTDRKRSGGRSTTAYDMGKPESQSQAFTELSRDLPRDAQSGPQGSSCLPDWDTATGSGHSLDTHLWFTALSKIFGMHLIRGNIFMSGYSDASDDPLLQGHLW